MMTTKLKIYILPVDKRLQPEKTDVIYPAYNHDYGVEQDFYKFLQTHPSLITKNAKTADFHYLPVYWSRWHLNHHFGETGLDELNNNVNEVVIDSQKTFSICAYDNGPKINDTHIIFFNASGGDIPLLSKPLIKPIWPTRKKYLCSFVGRTNTHPIRKKLVSELSGNKGFYFENTNKLPVSEYVKVLLQSYYVLSPRGKGGSSFRFYEAMQMARVPVMVADRDNRPFKRYIAWEKCSFYFNINSKIIETLNSIKLNECVKMGKMANKIWFNQLRYGKWCQYVIKELELKK